MRPKSLPAMLARPAGRAAARMSMSAGMPRAARVLGLVARGGAAAAAPPLPLEWTALSWRAPWWRPGKVHPYWDLWDEAEAARLQVASHDLA